MRAVVWAAQWRATTQICAVKIAPLDDVRTKNEIAALAACALPSAFVVRWLAAHEDHMSNPRASHFISFLFNLFVIIWFLCRAMQFPMSVVFLC
jgi:hypothetical protein